MNNRYAYAALITIIIVFVSYIYHFHYILKCNISDDTAVWAQLGDYAGGLLSPILSFISLVLLIKSLTLQNEANRSLSEELKNNEKTEKLRIFENHFFNMLDSQSNAFNAFKIEIYKNNVCISKKGVDAVIAIEEEIAILRSKNKNDDDIKSFLDQIDVNDQIFSATRRFYIIVKMTSENLSNNNGFSENERKSHLLTLINFTDFSLLRLIMMSIQFMSYQSTEYLKHNTEFKSILNEVDINWNLY